MNTAFMSCSWRSRSRASAMSCFSTVVPSRLFIWHVPALLAPDAGIRSVFQEVHELGAKALLALIGLHAGAALFHGLVLRDGVLR